MKIETDAYAENEWDGMWSDSIDGETYVEHMRTGRRLREASARGGEEVSGCDRTAIVLDC